MSKTILLESYYSSEAFIEVIKNGETHKMSYVFSNCNDGVKQAYHELWPVLVEKHGQSHWPIWSAEYGQFESNGGFHCGIRSIFRTAVIMMVPEDKVLVSDFAEWDNYIKYDREEGKPVDDIFQRLDQVDFNESKWQEGDKQYLILDFDPSWIVEIVEPKKLDFSW